MKDRIVICRHCSKTEYWGEMRWINGKCMCRNCYKSDYEARTGSIYKWDDLDGERPTMEDFLNQED